MDNPEHSELVDHLGAAYTRIAKILLYTVLPIELPPLQGSVYASENREAILHAFSILVDIPMSSEELIIVSRMLLDWLIASEKLFEDAEDPAEWKLQITAYALNRVYDGALALDRLRSQE